MWSLFYVYINLEAGMGYLVFAPNREAAGPLLGKVLSTEFRQGVVQTDSK